MPGGTGNKQEIPQLLPALAGGVAGTCCCSCFYPRVFGELLVQAGAQKGRVKAGGEFGCQSTPISAHESQERLCLQLGELWPLSLLWDVWMISDFPGCSSGQGIAPWSLYLALLLSPCSALPGNQAQEQRRWLWVAPGEVWVTWQEKRHRKGCQALTEAAQGMGILGVLRKRGCGPWAVV